MSKKIEWYVVTARHINGTTFTWKSRSEATAHRMADNARKGGELDPRSVRVTPPRSVAEQNARETNSPFMLAKAGL